MSVAEEGDKSMIRVIRSYSISLLLTAFFFSGCGAGFQAGSDVAQGRQALFRGDYPTALTYFQSATQADPSYIYGTELRQGTLSYLGRAQYLNGQLAPARDTLQKALAQHKSDNLARLYLGLTEAREGDRKSGLRDIEGGMKGIKDFLNYITTTFSNLFGQFWDPTQEIRKTVDTNLAMISKGNIDWQTLISNGEALAMNFEREPDRARQQEEQQIEMDQRR
jgi:tetratricopeptide (TPR) repeat protein